MQEAWNCMKMQTKKQALLAGYAKKCEHNISGETIVVRLDQLAANLEEKSRLDDEKHPCQRMGEGWRRWLVQWLL